MKTSLDVLSPGKESWEYQEAPVKWGQNTGSANVDSIKTYGQNSVLRSSLRISLNDAAAKLKKLKRAHVVSSMMQLEEKNYIKCSVKGCRCIFMSLLEMAEHVDSCEGAKSNRKLEMCKYCPHGTLSATTLSNHIAANHPVAARQQRIEYDNSVNESVKTKFSNSEHLEQTMKSHWRFYLEFKGCIMCLIPFCHYVTCFINHMTTHFLDCGPDAWETLKFSCDKCCGKTSSKKDLDYHIEKCHTTDLTHNVCSDQIKKFWDLTLKEYRISKCLVKDCRYVAHNITSLEKHYRYCRNPSEENFEVCTSCSCWFENTYDLWYHETHFHVCGQPNKIRTLMALKLEDVDKLSAKKTNPPQPDVTLVSGERNRKEGGTKTTTFLGELAKTIESESQDKDSVKARVTVGECFSWETEVPDVEIAAEVVNRKLPSYSVKTIMAESKEDRMRLLKLTESVTGIACSTPRKYLPPRPLDFVLDTPDALGKLRRKFAPTENRKSQDKIDDVKLVLGALKKTKKKIKRKAGGDRCGEKEAPPAKKPKRTIESVLLNVQKPKAMHVPTKPEKPCRTELGTAVTIKVEPRLGEANMNTKRYILAGNSVIKHVLGRHFNFMGMNEVMETVSGQVALVAHPSKIFEPKTFKVEQFAQKLDYSRHSQKTYSRSTSSQKMKNNDSSSKDGKKCTDSLSSPVELSFLSPGKFSYFGTENSSLGGHSSPFHSGKPLRTYGRNSYTTRKSLSVENTMSVNDESFSSDPKSLFTDKCARNSQDPLESSEEVIEIKSEPLDAEYDYPFGMFHENYDIFNADTKDDISLSAPFEIVRESSEGVLGGLYNDLCPWEQSKARSRSKRRQQRKVDELPPCSSQSLELSIKTDNQLAGSGSKEEFNGIANYLTKMNGSSIIAKPKILTVHTITYDETPTFGWDQSFRPSLSGTENLMYYTNEFLDLLHYLTNYNSYNCNDVGSVRVCRETTVYAVDDIIHDNSSKGAPKRNGSMKTRRGRSSGSVAQNSSRNKDDSSTVEEPGSRIEGANSQSSKKRKSSKKSTVETNESLIDDEVGTADAEGNEILHGLLKSKRGSRKCSDNRVDEVVPTRKKSLSKKGVEVEEISPEEECSPNKDEGKPVKKRGRPFKRKSKATQKGINVSRSSFNDSEISIKVEDISSDAVSAASSNEDEVKPVKKRGRPFKRKSKAAQKGINVPRSSFTDSDISIKVEDISSDAVSAISSSEDEVKPARKRGRPFKRKSKAAQKGINVPRSSFDEAGGSIKVEEDDEQPSGCLVPADQRIIFNSKLADPMKMVECAVCNESMTAALYKKHIIKHNHLCWLKGEEPMDLENEHGVERYLYRIYIRTRTPFTCEVCGTVKKSAQGFVTHRKFCGKSVDEQKEMMVSCSVCYKLLMPGNVYSHMTRNHGVVSNVPEAPSSIGGRKAAARCLDAIAGSVAAQNDKEFIDDAEELKAVEKHSWFRQVYTFCKRKVHRELKGLVQESFTPSDRKYHCLADSCTFSDENITNVIEHYRACDKSPLEVRCNECNFLTNEETRMINHVRMTHYDKAAHYAKNNFKSGESIDVTNSTTGACIPYVKSGELQSRNTLILLPALNWTNDLRTEHLSNEPVFPYWEVSDSLNFKSVDEFPSHVLLRDDSIRFKGSEGSPSWKVLKRFESEGLEDGVQVLYTGGIVRTFDWFPSSTRQYLAVAVTSVDSENINGRPIHSGSGHFQIWSLGEADNFSDDYATDLRFCLAVCHDFGEIWDLECCPAGGETEKRLGLVAIGTSSGVVAVYAIPNPQKSSTKKAIKPDPAVLLKLGTKESLQITRISWSKTKPHRLIAAGFTSGLVAVWDLTTTSSLLKSGNTLLPFKSFYPHLAIITGLSFCPVNEFYLVTGCAEKSTKIWNLRDTTVNHGESTKGLVTDVAWLPLWMATLASLDDNYSVGTTTVTLNPVRNFIFQPQPAVTQAESTGLSISVNNWLNTFVCGYDSGQIVLNVERRYIQHQNDDRRKVLCTLLSPKLHDFNPDAPPSVVSCKSYSSTSSRYGLILNQKFEINFQTKIKSNPYTDLACFPLTPVNKVLWNPNPNSFLTLAAGLHSGFVIVGRVKLPSLETKLIKSFVNNFKSQDS